ncbi:MAG TPA: YceI family protein [Candidatus Dormibacteraeota bacterium]
MSETFSIDPSHSSIGFAVKHMMITTVRGQFREFGGTVELPDGGDTTKAQAEFTIKTASIDTGVGPRDEHLRSGDFFDAAKHPELRYRSSHIESLGGGRYRADGELTMRGETRPVSLEVEVGERVRDPWGNERVGLSARGKLNRKEWGLNWNQGLETGGVLVSDEVKLEVEAALVHSLAEQAAA